MEAQKAALGLPSAGDPGKIAKLLREALPGDGGGVSPIVPDIIGEAAVIRAFSVYDHRGCEAVRRAFSQSAEEVAATLVRLIHDFGAADNAVQVDWIVGLVQWQQIGLPGLMTIANILPSDSPMRASIAVALHKTIADSLLHNHCLAGDPAISAEFALALNNLAVSAGRMGEIRSAIEVIRSAIQICRSFKGEQFQKVDKVAAMLLMNLASFLLETGSAEEALPAAQESLCLRCRLMGEDRQKFEIDVARSMLTLAMCFRSLGDRAGALEAATRALALVEEAFRDGHASDESVLWQALENLAISCREAGDRKGAVSASGRAVQSLRRWCAEYPRRPKKDLASALHTFANCLWDCGNYAHAYESICEATEIYEGDRMKLWRWLKIRCKYVVASTTQLLVYLGRNWLNRFIH